MRSRKFLTVAEAAVLAVLALGLTVWLVLPKDAGRWVVLERSGEELGRFALDAPRRVAVAGANGFSLILVIENGQAHVEDATCPDLVCQRHRPIANAGEAIVCLPGQVSVRVEGGERDGPDVITG